MLVVTFDKLYISKLAACEDDFCLTMILATYSFQ